MMQKKFVQLCRLILSDKNTRNLFFFLVINLIFAFVELTYGLWTNSLGLISDSFHMFFDCSALLLGLAASIVAKWKPSDKFSYGFGRAEVLAGLANGLFLLFIALFIMKEAIERTFEPPEVHHERLFAISVLGFLVNLIGIFVFQHGGQGHCHGGGNSSCSHSHATSKHKESTSALPDYKYDNLHGYSHYSNPTVIEDHQHSDHHHHNHQHNHDHRNQNQTIVGSVALDMNGYSTNSSTTTQLNSSVGGHDDHHHHHHGKPFQKHNDSDLEPFLIKDSSHKHSHNGAGGHRGQIMQSVFLHIIADTLGSVGVIISAILMNQFGWMIADPLCSLFIAILISVSVYPLLKDSIFILMQRTPVELDDKLPDCLFKIQRLDGVINVHETHFWTLNSDSYTGCLKLEVASSANYKQIQEQVERLLHNIGVNRIHIQIDHAAQY